MPANVVTMFYVRETPWYELGVLNSKYNIYNDFHPFHAQNLFNHYNTCYSKEELNSVNKNYPYLITLYQTHNFYHLFYY
jgi:hypothetical protein